MTPSMTAAPGMVEEVAKALRFVMYGVPESRPLDADSTWLVYARVAIDAMRSLDKVVVRQAADSLDEWESYIKSIWAVCIDAALKGEG